MKSRLCFPPMGASLCLVLTSVLGACTSGETADVTSKEDDENSDGPGVAAGSGGKGGKEDPTPGGGGTSPNAQRVFPGGRLAAVSLTYDDGLDGQLKYAIPALEERGLRATFFLSSFEGVDHFWSLPNLTDPLNLRHAAWSSVGETHEIGGHTVNHPCDSNGNPDFRPGAYDSARMAEELDDSLLRLARLGAAHPVSFAYPCSSDLGGIAGGQSMRPLVDARFLFARTSAVGVNLPSAFAAHSIAQKFGDTDKMSGATLIAFVDEAIEKGGWAVFTFHGIGPEVQSCPDLISFDLDVCALNYLTTENEAHEELLDYLVQKSDIVFTAPMGEVAASLSQVP